MALVLLLFNSCRTACVCIVPGICLPAEVYPIHVIAAVLFSVLSMLYYRWQYGKRLHFSLGKFFKKESASLSRWQFNAELGHLPFYVMTKRATGLSEYNDLSEDKQLETLHCYGVYIGKRKAGRQTVVLFQLYGFYVEVHYKHYRKHIDHTVATDNAGILHPYIDQINIRDLDQNKD